MTAADLSSAGGAGTSVLLEHLFRHQVGRVVARLARILGPAGLDLAEESMQDAMLRALQTWPYQGIPENPDAWLFRVAHNSAIDSIRRVRFLEQNSSLVLAELTRGTAVISGDRGFEEQLGDDELRMIFMCCHPEIARDARVALSLKTVSGFSVREISAAFLADDAAIAQRLVRAKRQLREASITLDLPSATELDDRLDSALETIYFIFNEGYAAHEGQVLIRRDLCFEALRLGRLLAGSSLATPRVHALVAVMALQAARLPARIDEAGDLILLEDQNREQWDQRLIALGFHHFNLSIGGENISEYQVQAAIAAVYMRADDLRSIDWRTILELYDQLLEISGFSPVVALNRAVAVAKVHGAAEALGEIETLRGNPQLCDYYLLLAVRGYLLGELDRCEKAAACWRAALECRCSEPDRRFLRRKLAGVNKRESA